MNNYVAITCLLALTASSLADPSLGVPVYAPAHSSVDYYAYPSYAFDYAVKDPVTGDNKAQWEKRQGDVVKGAYSLVEPDGSLRIVEYWADDQHGFNAIVKRIGPNVHPSSVPIINTPIYKAAIPTIAGTGPIAPWSVGPVSGLEGLAGAPLLSGVPLLSKGSLLGSSPLLSGAISTSSLVKSIPISTLKTIVPNTIIDAPLPIIKSQISPLVSQIGPISPWAGVPINAGLSQLDLIGAKGPIGSSLGGLNELDLIGVKGPIRGSLDGLDELDLIGGKGPIGASYGGLSELDLIGARGLGGLRELDLIGIKGPTNLGGLRGLDLIGTKGPIIPTNLDELRGLDLIGAKGPIATTLGGIRELDLIGSKGPLLGSWGGSLYGSPVQGKIL